MDISLTEARDLVSNGYLWPKVRDYLARGGEFGLFPKGAKSRMKLLDEKTLAEIELWREALTRAEEWKAVVDGAKVRELKAAYPGVYPEVFRYTAYFSKFKSADSDSEEFLMLLFKLKFPEVYKLCSS